MTDVKMDICDEQMFGHLNKRLLCSFYNLKENWFEFFSSMKRKNCIFHKKTFEITGGKRIKLFKKSVKDFQNVKILCLMPSKNLLGKAHITNIHLISRGQHPYYTFIILRCIRKYKGIRDIYLFGLSQ